MGDKHAQRCPFCGYQAKEYDLLLHLETYHAEGDSPFVAREEDRVGTPQPDERYTECPVEGCGEVLLAREMDDHVEFHAQEADLPDDGTSTAEVAGPELLVPEPAEVAPRTEAREREREQQQRHRNPPPVSSRQAHAIQSWRHILSMPRYRTKRQATEPPSAGSSTVAGSSKKQLGKAELGKYAHERRMPDWLVEHLQKGWGVKGSGVLPVLRQLLEQCPSTEYAYLCHPCVEHVSKLKREGGFCGYRNIQMMTSYIAGTGVEGSDKFHDRMPTIFEIQDFIEAAWDKGINAQGRIETGGVKGTRKYIGTPEAQAVFCSLGIPCEAQGFKDREPGKSEARLLRDVEKYFQSGIFDPASKVRATDLPPIYFQHPGHSMTIVGLERMTTGHVNLLVFDPMFRDAASITRLIGCRFQHKVPDSLLKPYRRGDKYLRKYHEFEALRLRPPPEALDKVKF